jgi:two-component system sensor kinase FixL
VNETPSRRLGAASSPRAAEQRDGHDSESSSFHEGGAPELRLSHGLRLRWSRDTRAAFDDEFLRQVIDISSNLIYAKDRRGRFTLANQSLAQMYGCSADELIGRTDAAFNLDATEVEGFRRTDLRVFETRQESFAAEEKLTDVRGTVHWLQTTRRPVLSEDGTVTQVLVSSTDITARKQRELEIEHQRNELAHFSRVTMLSELAGALAHELNQPLAAILSNAQAALRFLSRDDADLEEITDILRDIVRDDKRAGEVIEGMRALLRKAETRYEPLDINAVIETVVKLVRSDLLNAGVDLNLDLLPTLPIVKGDRVQLQQVLINLIMNGCEAMRKNPTTQRELSVSSALSGDDTVLVCVKDQGRGIEPEDRKHVFEPFFSTKPNGLGLGLAVCHRIMSAHGGALWVADTESRGASFCFSLPAGRDGLDDRHA